VAKTIKYPPIHCSSEWHVRHNPRAAALYNLAMHITKGGKEPFYLSKPQTSAYFGWSGTATKSAFRDNEDAGLFVLVKLGRGGDLRHEDFANQYKVIPHSELKCEEHYDRTSGQKRARVKKEPTARVKKTPGAGSINDPLVADVSPKEFPKESPTSTTVASPTRTTVDADDASSSSQNLSAKKQFLKDQQRLLHDYGHGKTNAAHREQSWEVAQDIGIDTYLGASFFGWSMTPMRNLSDTKTPRARSITRLGRFSAFWNRPS